MMKSPIFIIGANRSGTTLLRLILNGHSQIAIPDELEYFQSKMAGVDIRLWQNPPISKSHYQVFISEFLKSKSEVLPEIDLKQLESKIVRYNLMNFREPYRLTMETWAKHYGKQRWGEKTPVNGLYIDILLEMFPDAKFLQIIRDPRAVVSSMNQDNFTCYSNDSTINSLNLQKQIKATNNFLEELVPKTQKMTIKYEDLVINPKNTIVKICEFLEESFEENLLNFHLNSHLFMKKQAMNQYNKLATQPISGLNFCKWKQKLSSHDISIIESICSKYMKTYGYFPDGKALNVYQKSKMLFKSLYWHFFCWNNRYNRAYFMHHKVLILERIKHRTLRLSN